MSLRARLPLVPVIGGIVFKQLYGRAIFRALFRDEMYAPGRRAAARAHRLALRRLQQPLRARERPRRHARHPRHPRRRRPPPAHRRAHAGALGARGPHLPGAGRPPPGPRDHRRPAGDHGCRPRAARGAPARVHRRCSPSSWRASGDDEGPVVPRSRRRGRASGGTARPWSAWRWSRRSPSSRSRGPWVARWDPDASDFTLVRDALRRSAGALGGALAGGRSPLPRRLRPPRGRRPRLRSRSASRPPAIATAIGAAIGVIAGMTEGTRLGALDTLAMRLVDVFLALPFAALHHRRGRGGGPHRRGHGAAGARRRRLDEHRAPGPRPHDADPRPRLRRRRPRAGGRADPHRLAPRAAQPRRDAGGGRHHGRGADDPRRGGARLPGGGHPPAARHLGADAPRGRALPRDAGSRSSPCPASPSCWRCSAGTASATGCATRSRAAAATQRRRVQRAAGRPSTSSSPAPRCSCSRSRRPTRSRPRSAPMPPDHEAPRRGGRPPRRHLRQRSARSTPPSPSTRPRTPSSARLRAPRHVGHRGPHRPRPGAARSRSRPTAAPTPSSCAPGPSSTTGTGCAPATSQRSLERLLHPRTPSPAASMYATIKGFAAFHAGRADHLEGVRVIGERLLAIDLDAPDATFLPKMTLGFAAPGLRLGGRRRRGRTAQALPCGAGPFRVDAWDPDKRRAPGPSRGLLRARTALPRRRRVVGQRALDDPALQVRARRARLRDASSPAPTATSTSLPPAWSRLGRWTVHAQTNAIFLNTEVAALRPARDPPRGGLRPRPRRARADAHPTSSRPIASSRPRSPALPATEPMRRHDLAAALDAMARAGYPFDPATGAGRLARAHRVPHRPRHRRPAVRGDLAAAARARRAAHPPAPGHLRDLPRGEPAPAHGADGPRRLVGRLPRPFRTSSSPSSPRAAIQDEGSENVSFFSNAELDAVLARAHGEPDPARRDALYLRAEEIVRDEAPWIPTYGTRTYELWQPDVRGYAPHPVLRAAVRGRVARSQRGSSARGARAPRLGTLAAEERGEARARPRDPPARLGAGGHRGRGDALVRGRADPPRRPRAHDARAPGLGRRRRARARDLRARPAPAACSTRATGGGSSTARRPRSDAARAGASPELRVARRSASTSTSATASLTAGRWSICSRRKIPRSAELALAAVLVQLAMGLSLGLLAAARRGTAWDDAAMGVSLLGMSAPTFLLGLVLQYVLAYKWGGSRSTATARRRASTSDRWCCRR